MSSTKLYENPRLYSDTVLLLNLLLKKYKSMDRAFRILFMEQKIYPLLTSIMENSLILQFVSKERKTQMLEIFQKMRVLLEIIKSYLTICFENKQLLQSFYLSCYRKTEEISKQVLGWKNSIFNTTENKHV